jgi:hypothetical protein
VSGTLIIPALGCGPCEEASAAAPAAPVLLAHDGWYPGVDLTRLRAETRLRESVTPERLRDAAVSAMIWIGDQLDDWRIGQSAAGHGSLAVIPAPQVAGESRLAILYRQAVGAWAKAQLVERYRDVDLTAAGDRQVEDLNDAIGELRRDAIHAVRALLGVTRTAVELI